MIQQGKSSFLLGNINFHITLTNQFNKRLKTAKFVIFRVIGSETNLKRNEASYAAFF